MAQKTLFYEKHLEQGAKIVDFFGWLLPIEYSSILKETKAARTDCVLFDVSHMGRFSIKGHGALSFLQGLATNDISLIEKGGVQYNLLLNRQGTVIDDLLIYCLGDEYKCVVNASNKEKVWHWFRDNMREGAELTDETVHTVLLSLQGPASFRIIDSLCPGLSDRLGYMKVVETDFAGLPCLISRTGYTGEDGFELCTINSLGLELWDRLIEAGRSHGLCCGGLGARDILRIEAGYPLYGHELDDKINPLEASLAWAVKPEAKDFIGREKITGFLKKGLCCRRVGFVMEEKGVPRQGYEVYGPDGRQSGTVSSGTFSPNTGTFIGMAFLAKEFSPIGTEIGIKIRDRKLKAKVVRLPFVPYRHK